MTFNRFMHPRNIYKNKADFETLSLKFPEFRKHANQDLSGRITIDFKNPEALRALTVALLKKDFDLDVEIPTDRLIPTIPLRLNYILWLEDIFQKEHEIIRGIDIGTGASCVYPLLGAKKNNWEFLAVEIDSESFLCARRNVVNNGLQEKIKIILGNNESVLLNHIKDINEKYHFCMCNPPFFLNDFNGEVVDCPNTAAPIEKMTKGGEIEFIRTIVNESLQLKDKIKIYTTMVGQKSSLKTLKNELKKHLLNFTITEFCQGKTMRWGLAWTWDDNFKFPISKHPHRKYKPPLTYTIPKPANLKMYKVGIYLCKIRSLLEELQIEWEDLKVNHNYAKILIKAKQNTWSHQRRKRRELLRKEKEMIEPPEKRAKMDTSNSSVHDIASVSNQIIQSSDHYILECHMYMKHLGQGIVIELKYIKGDGHDLLHQVMQYFKNKFQI